ncbi:hypothetical protein AVEN_219138-1 [Araneus ventricosus]|uniref:DDE-1 domain-containing protein n=1 Tax=Araneus ventricosus TaxID=182803 RepID=A0A4Y2FQE1_ARAVE|nr:hypothetical protein AVEN_219138-1 [Araneus ventricosus]
MDETGISTVPNRTPKMIIPEGKKTVRKISSAERAQAVTGVCCMSATGVFVPPALILHRKRMNPLLYKDSPNGTLPLISDNGYMNSHLFIDRLKHFVKHAKPSAEDLVILIADNHTSDFLSQAVLFRRENHITFLSLPPHASHVLQQLDKCFFATLKALYSSEAEKWLLQNLGKIYVSIQSIVQLPRHEKRGAKRKRKSQKSKIMTSSPFKNLLEKNEKEKETERNYGKGQLSPTTNRRHPGCFGWKSMIYDTGFEEWKLAS